LLDVQMFYANIHIHIKFFVLGNSPFKVLLFKTCRHMLSLHWGGFQNSRFIIKNRSESFSAKPRDWKSRWSRGRQLDEPQKDLFWMIYRLCQKSRIRSLELGSIHFRVSTTVVNFILSKLLLLLLLFLNISQKTDFF
jgi:hypothetical protein